MKRTSNQGVAWCAVLLLSLVAVATGCKQDESQDDAAAKPPVVVRVGYIPIAECAHLYVGVSKKYFEQEGLKLELQPMKGGAIILPALQKGDLDIGFTNVVSVITINTKRKRTDSQSIVCFAGGTYERAGNTNHALLCRKDSTITVSSLVNPETRIAVNTTRNIEELMLRHFLAQKGETVSSLTLVPIGFPEMLRALAAR